MKPQKCPWCKKGDILECNPAANGTGWWCSNRYAKKKKDRCDWQGERCKKGEHKTAREHRTECYG